MNLKTILIGVGLIAGVVAFLLFTSPPEETAGTPPSEHTLGAGTAGVTLVEYGDFQCPACAQYFPVLQQVKDKYGDQIVFQFRHFPLETIHTNARAASRAAEAAGLQGKFWEMHDHLFTYQNEWGEVNDPLSMFEGYARTVGVEDMAKFSEDYRSSAVNDTINADLQAGRDLGAQSTPTFILNGQKLDPSPSASLDAFSALIDDAIGEQRSDEVEAEADSEQPEAKPEDE